MASHHRAFQKGMSTIYKADARLKIIACVAYVLSVVTTPSGEWVRLCLYIAPVLAILLLARLSIGRVLTRSAVVVPFALMIAAFVPFLTEGQTVATFHLFWARLQVTQEGLMVLGEVVSKSWLSVVGLVIFSSITAPRELVAGMRKLGLPAVLAATLFLTSRYLTLFADEAKQMERARRCRAVRPWYRWGMRSAAGMVASLFIRACDMGERVHLAMLSRGFDGEVREAGSSPLSISAVAACLFFVLLMVGIRVWKVNW